MKVRKLVFEKEFLVDSLEDFKGLKDDVNKYTDPFFNLVFEIYPKDELERAEIIRALTVYTRERIMEIPELLIGGSEKITLLNHAETVTDCMITGVGRVIVR